MQLLFFYINVFDFKLLMQQLILMPHLCKALNKTKWKFLEIEVPVILKELEQYQAFGPSIHRHLYIVC